MNVQANTAAACTAPIPAIPASAITPGRWWFRWIDGHNIEQIRRVVVLDLGGVSLWVRFADEQWQPRPDSTPTLVGYLPGESGFLPPDAYSLSEGAAP